MSKTMQLIFYVFLPPQPCKYVLFMYSCSCLSVSYIHPEIYLYMHVRKWTAGILTVSSPIWNGWQQCATYTPIPIQTHTHHRRLRYNVSDSSKTLWGGGGEGGKLEMHQTKLNNANNAIHSGMGCIAYIFGPHNAHCNGLYVYCTLSCARTIMQQWDSWASVESDSGFDSRQVFHW